MQIKTLLLYNFRNYSHLEFEPGDALNLVCGENAQGKTNLLEAVFLCAFGRSHRTTHDSELILNGCDRGQIKLKLDSEQGGEHIISITMDGNTKTVELDGERVKRFGDLMGNLKVVMFSPESLTLIKGSPAERRRFFDMGISQLSRTYFFKLQQYNNALKQRNALLKNPDAISYDSYIKVWDKQLAQSGSYIIKSRARFIEMLKQGIIDMHSRLSVGKDDFEIEYLPSVKCDDPEQLCDCLMSKLATSLEDDIRRGSTYFGPHKDDIMTKTNGLDTRVYASQGQQRTAALALKLSEIELIRSVSGESPVVLLDDVFSELDESRCNALLEAVADCQCIFTSAQEFMSDLIETDIDVWYCNSGRIVN